MHKYGAPTTTTAMKYSCIAVVGAALALFCAAALASMGAELRSATDHPTQRMCGVTHGFTGGVKEKLRYSCDLPAPVRRTDQLLISVHAVGMNPVDFKLRRARLPIWLAAYAGRKITGADVASVVLEAPRGSAFARGDRVAAMLPIVFTRWGAAAEVVAVRAAHAAKIPDNISFIDAASIPLVALTVVQGLERGGVVANSAQHQKIVIHAGAGGVGTFALQWVRAVLGMSEVVASCSPSSTALVTSLGATRALDYHDGNNTALWSLRNFDVVLDPMSHRYEARTLARSTVNSSAPGVLRPGGTYLGIMSSDWALDAAGDEVVGDGASFRRAFVSWLRCALGSVSAVRHRIVAVQPDGETLARVFERVADGSVRAVIHAVLPLRDAAKAHALLEKGSTHGKIVLRVVGGDDAPRATAIGGEVVYS